MTIRDELFSPIDHTSLVDSIIEEIENLILTGVLRDGNKLPSERDLAERMSVSRPKVREALKQLEENGLISVRHGEGTFVAPLIGSAMSPALIGLYARHTVAFLDYLEFRMEQESFAAGLAAERASPTDKEILAGVMSDLESAHHSKDIEGSQDADIRFHSAIIDASHNSLLVHTMSSIYELTRQNVFYNREFLRSMDGTGELLLEQHREIYQAIVDGHPKQAADAAQDHIAFVEKSYLTDQSRDRREQTALRRKAMLNA